MDGKDSEDPHVKNTSNGKSSRTRNYAIILAAIAFLLLCVVALYVQTKLNSSTHTPETPKKQTQVSTTQSRQFAVSINGKIYVDKNGNALAYIKNSKLNAYDMKVKIKNDSTGEILYESDAIEPGNQIDTITLESHLEVGNYNATAEFYALDRTSGKVSGNVIVDVKLIVEN